MHLEKNIEKGTWLVRFYYTDWQGIRHKKTRSGFNRKRDAVTWANDFLTKQECDLNISFRQFTEIYFEDISHRLKQSTIYVKREIFKTKLLPYFGNKTMNEITAPNIRQWQNEMMKRNYAPTYLKSMNNQLVSIFSYAERYYDLKSNPCRKAGTMGRCDAGEMSFWTKNEYMHFIRYVDSPLYHAIFQMLYWTGMRIGELLALTRADFDFQAGTVSITKSYRRFQGQDIITTPKTERSNRLVSLPPFLLHEISELFRQSKPHPSHRVFYISKSVIARYMDVRVKRAGIHRIRIHDLRHSHASLLIEMGCPALEIAERLGHAKVETTLNTYSHLYPHRQSMLASRLEEEHEKGIVLQKEDATETN